VTTSLSNLIKREDDFRFDIESFEEEDFANGLDIFSEEHANGGLVLPLGDQAGHGLTSLHGYGSGQKMPRIEREAYEKGFEQGQKDGVALGEKKAQETWKKMMALLEELEDLKGRIFEETEEEIIRLSVTMARKIIKKEVAMDSDTLRRSVHHALKFLKDKSFVRVLINPDDMKILEPYLPEFATDNKIENLELAEDHCVEPGGCILETGFGRINATLEGQLAELEMEMKEAFHTREGTGDGAQP
jgi:flagellar biosynthesis/type III secretory pathway protein FliH